MMVEKTGNRCDEDGRREKVIRIRSQRTSADGQVQPS